MGENNDSEITFKAKYKLPNIQEITRATHDSRPPPFKELIGLNGGAPTLLPSFGKGICPHVQMTERNLHFLLGPIPKFKEIQTTLKLGEREPIRPIQLPHLPNGCHCYAYRLDMDDLKRNAERAIFEVTLRIDASNQMAIVPRAEVEKSRCRNGELASLLSADTFTDVSFKVGGAEIKAHKAILSARSEYFNRMFSSGMKECQTDEVNVEDCTPAHFKLFLQAVYGGFSSLENVDLDSVIGIIGLADKYQLPNLIESCLDFIRRSIFFATVPEILKAASKLNNEELRLIAFDYLKKINEKQRWKILLDLGDDEISEKFLASL